ncbi:hypothetical protein GcM3_136019 [Golovinomyces cichoracearum]|uniref:Uncharacterized protein n=1 Tax=Golovinomyces cichoracearum TaxID=62708 RepID=A0A420I2A6_9PEZI|nr:hypothetical protein GcM3_136019 [Golovinomyces cichoracearum]
MSGEDIRMMDGSSDKTPSLGGAELTNLLKRLEDQEIRENNHRIEMEKMRTDMQTILSIIERQNDEQIHERVQSTNLPADSSSQNRNP